MSFRFAASSPNLQERSHRIRTILVQFVAIELRAKTGAQHLPQAGLAHDVGLRGFISHAIRFRGLTDLVRNALRHDVRRDPFLHVFKKAGLLDDPFTVSAAIVKVFQRRTHGRRLAESVWVDRLLGMAPVVAGPRFHVVDFLFQLRVFLR